MKPLRDKIYIPVCILGILPMVLSLAGCDAQETPGGPDSRAFSSGTCRRAAEEALSLPDDNSQFTRLYLAQRMQEHDLFTDPLHCAPTDRYTITGGHYRVENLFGQWYKLAFVCVPKWEGGGGERLLTEENPREKTCDFNRLLIDYNAVMEYQQLHMNAAAERDLNIYRRIIDRWTDPDADTSADTGADFREDVEMVRTTGKLVIDMGIAADQFRYPVRSMSLTLLAPLARVYIHDNSTDEVIPAPEANPADRVYTIDFTTLGDAEYAAAVKRHTVFDLSLLPQTLRGGVTVTFKGMPDSVYLPLGEDAANGDTHVEVRKNSITTVLYNGMTGNEFEVRYAGFDAGHDATVDVDDDVWDGWQDK